MACCLCQEKHITETPCRTIKFQCENLCTTSAPQCGRLPDDVGVGIKSAQFPRALGDAIAWPHFVGVPRQRWPPRWHQSSLVAPGQSQGH